MDKLRTMVAKLITPYRVDYPYFNVENLIGRADANSLTKIINLLKSYEDKGKNIAQALEIAKSMNIRKLDPDTPGVNWREDLRKYWTGDAGMYKHLISTPPDRVTYLEHVAMSVRKICEMELNRMKELQTEEEYLIDPGVIDTLVTDEDFMRYEEKLAHNERVRAELTGRGRKITEMIHYRDVVIGRFVVEACNAELINTLRYGIIQWIQSY